MFLRVLLAIALATSAVGDRTSQSTVRMPKVGVVDAGSRTCSYRFELGDPGGDYELIGGKGGKGLRDVTGYAVVGNGLLCVSTAGIYGDPALYLIGGEKCQVRKLVGGVTGCKDGSYCDDYFELAGVWGSRDSLYVSYWYAPSCDSLNLDTRPGIVLRCGTFGRH